MTTFGPGLFHPLPGVLALAVALGSLSGCSDDKTPPENPPLTVLAEKVSLSEYVPKARVTGEIAARVQRDLAFQVAGRISERLANVGDHVAAGQLVARLDPAEKEADVRSAEASVSAAEAVLTQARSTFGRQQSLLDQQIATRKDYEAAQEGLRTAEAALEVAKTERETAEEQLSYTELRAEKAGVITAVNAEVGQVVQAASAVYALAEDGPRDAIFDIDEGVLGLGITPEVNIALVSDPTVVAHGSVREVSPTVDQTSGTVRVKVEILNPPRTMTLGAAVIGEATFPSEKAIMIASTSVSSQGGAPAVWVIDPADHKVSLKPIRIQSYDAESVVVQSGLQEGEIIVSRGGQLLHPGQIVDFSQEASK